MNKGNFVNKLQVNHAAHGFKELKKNKKAVTTSQVLSLRMNRHEGLCRPFQSWSCEKWMRRCDGVGANSSVREIEKEPGESHAIVTQFQHRVQEGRWVRQGGPGVSMLLEPQLPAK